jgi:hypothetical protein
MFTRAAFGDVKVTGENLGDPELGVIELDVA